MEEPASCFNDKCSRFDPKCILNCGVVEVDEPPEGNCDDFVACSFLVDKYTKLKALCDSQFKETMFQPYAGANQECFFCGATEGIGRETEHTETCPFLAYKDIEEVL